MKNFGRQRHALLDRTRFYFVVVLFTLTGAPSQAAEQSGPFGRLESVFSYETLKSDSLSPVYTDAKYAAAGTLPQYIFHVPNEKNDGHDTGVSYADKLIVRLIRYPASERHLNR